MIVSARAMRAFVAPILAAGALLGAGLAHAQNAAPSGVRGTVTALSGDMFKVHTRDGKDADGSMAANFISAGEHGVTPPM